MPNQVRDCFAVQHCFRQCRFQILDARIANRDLGVNYRVDNEAKPIGRLFDSLGRPPKPARVLRHQVEQDMLSTITAVIIHRGSVP